MYETMLSVLRHVRYTEKNKNSGNKLHHSTTILQLRFKITLFMYSCVKNVIRKITLEIHQTYYDLDLIINNKKSNTTAGVFRSC